GRPPFASLLQSSPTPKLGFDEPVDEVGHCDLRSPMQLPYGLRGVPDAVADIRRAEQYRVDLHMIAPVEPEAGERTLHEILEASRGAGRDHEILRGLMR